MNQFVKISTLLIFTTFGVAIGLYLGIVSNRWSLREYVSVTIDALQSPSVIENKLTGMNTVAKDTIHVFADEEVIDTLLGLRKVALKAGVLLKEQKSYWPAQLIHDGDTFKSKVRLKGDCKDHLNSDRWSLRVKLKKKDRLREMRKFAIQNPKTRNFLSEWMIYKFFKQEGFPSLQYDFVKVFVNGKDNGIYAIEESFGDHVLSNNGFEVGPILKIDEALWWQVYRQPGAYPFYDQYQHELVKSYNLPKTPNDSIKALHDFAIKQLNAFRKGSKSLEQIIDIDKTARFYAICDLFSADHGVSWNNRRFYLNPSTQLIEPIPYDLDGGHFKETLIYHGYYRVSPSLLKEYQNSYFENESFYSSYVKWLDHYATSEVVSDFLVDIEDDLIYHLNLMHQNDPFYEFDTDFLAQKQTLIKNNLYPVGGVEIFSSTENQTLECVNINPFPIEIIKYRTGEDEIIAMEEPINIKQHKYNTVIEGLTINLPSDTKEVYWRIKGMKVEYSTNVKLKQPSFDKIQRQVKSKNQTLLSGKIRLKETLVVSETETLFIESGTEIELENNSEILVFGTVYANGTNEQPIQVISRSNNNIWIEGEANKSIFNHCIFSNFKNRPLVAKNTHVAFNHCSFNRSSIGLEHCEAKITGSTFNENNEGIRSINSQLKLKTNTFHKITKGLSASNSQLCARNNLFDSGSIAIQLDRHSFLEEKNLIVRNYDYALQMTNNSVSHIQKAKLQNIKTGIEIASNDDQYASRTDLENITIIDVDDVFNIDEQSTVYLDGEKVLN